MGFESDYMFSLTFGTIYRQNKPNCDPSFPRIVIWFVFISRPNRKAPWDEMRWKDFFGVIDFVSLQKECDIEYTWVWKLHNIRLLWHSHGFCIFCNTDGQGPAPPQDPHADMTLTSRQDYSSMICQIHTLQLWGKISSGKTLAVKLDPTREPSTVSKVMSK